MAEMYSSERCADEIRLLTPCIMPQDLISPITYTSQAFHRQKTQHCNLLDIHVIHHRSPIFMYCRTVNTPMTWTLGALPLIFEPDVDRVGWKALPVQAKPVRICKYRDEGETWHLMGLAPVLIWSLLEVVDWYKLSRIPMSGRIAGKRLSQSANPRHPGKRSLHLRVRLVLD